MFIFSVMYHRWNIMSLYCNTGKVCLGRNCFEMFVWKKIFLDQIDFWTKFFFRPKKILSTFFSDLIYIKTYNFSGPIIFMWTKKFFFDQVFFGTKIFFGPIFFHKTNFFWTNIFPRQKNFWTQNFLGLNFFVGQRYFWPKTF